MPTQPNKGREDNPPLSITTPGKKLAWLFNPGTSKIQREIVISVAEPFSAMTSTTPFY